MAAKNALLKAVPYQVERSLKKLGADLKTARLRRNLTIEEVAQKIGAGRFVVADAEKGKASTGIAIYVAMLWVYGFLDRFGDVADPSKDEEGTTFSLTRERARRSRKLDNDF